MNTAAATYSRVSNASGVLVIPENPNRFAIILSTPAGRTTGIQLGAADAAGNGVILDPTFTMVQLSEAVIGTAVQQTITLTDSLAAVQTFAYIEIVKVQ